MILTGTSEPQLSQDQGQGHDSRPHTPSPWFEGTVGQQPCCDGKAALQDRILRPLHLLSFPTTRPRPNSRRDPGFPARHTPSLCHQVPSSAGRTTLQGRGRRGVRRAQAASPHPPPPCRRPKPCSRHDLTHTAESLSLWGVSHPEAQTETPTSSFSLRGPHGRRVDTCQSSAKA